MGKGKGRVSTYLPLKGLVKNGYDNIYITNSPYASPDDSEPGIEVVTIKDPFTKTKYAYSRLYMLLFYYPVIYPQFIYHAIRKGRKRNVAAVICHSYWLAFVGYVLARIFKAKYISKFYGIGMPSLPGHPDLLRKSSFWYPADLFIITNDGSNGYEYALKRGVSADKIAFLRNGIEKQANLNKDDLLYKRLAPNNEKLLLTVSRLVSSKNVDKIIDAFYELSKTMSGIRLVIVGDGLQRKELETKVSQLGISDRVCFVGAVYHKDIFRYQSVADIFISMNAISSLSNPVFEAMASGRCVIALDRGATRELIKDGQNGIVIESFDELKDAIISLLSNPDRIARLGLQAKKTIDDTWLSWEERIQIEMEMINSLCDNKTPQVCIR
ncbi:MAG: glycosyltransferase family 4 protein [Muribaculaceae bacterium]|nr:glycosyltransferase family 4 protein [Muribaculaceae bacterium]